MKRGYWFMAGFGLLITAVLILGQYLVSGNNVFLGSYGERLVFILYSYILSLTFFVIFTVTGAIKMASVHGGQSLRWFIFSFVSFTVGSMIMSLLAFILSLFHLAL